MESYNFTLKFDSEIRSLNVENGLSVKNLAKLLKALTDAIPLPKEKQMVLSGIENGSYALKISTNSSAGHAHLTVVHNKISDNDYEGLSNNEIKYAKAFKEVIEEENVFAVVKDRDGVSDAKIVNIDFASKIKYYYQTSTIYGVITNIGSANLDSKVHIKINKVPFNIEVSKSQEKVLCKFYKSGILELTITKQIKLEGDSVESAILESYKVCESKSFFESLDDLTNEYSNDIFGEEDGVTAVRKLRDSIYE